MSREEKKSSKNFLRHWKKNRELSENIVLWWSFDPIQEVVVSKDKKKNIYISLIKSCHQNEQWNAENINEMTKADVYLLIGFGVRSWLFARLIHHFYFGQINIFVGPKIQINTIQNIFLQKGFLLFSFNSNNFVGRKKKLFFFIIIYYCILLF